jgi:hypothetical protein
MSGKDGEEKHYGILRGEAVVWDSTVPEEELDFSARHGVSTILHQLTRAPYAYEDLLSNPQYHAQRLFPRKPRLTNPHHSVPLS